jgi:hypothetical protein
MRLDTIRDMDGAVQNSENATGAVCTDQSQPRDRNDFEIAIICVLPREASAVSALFDKPWDNQTYGKASRDLNTYSTGVIGHHNVVLVHMPNMGKVAAATAAACLRASFPGAPFGNQPGEGILLGDVISEGLVQYDLGRKFPNHMFMRKDTPRDNLPRPGPKVRAALAKLQPNRAEAGSRIISSGLATEVERAILSRSDRRQTLQVNIPA